MRMNLAEPLGHLVHRRLVLEQHRMVKDETPLVGLLDFRQLRAAAIAARRSAHMRGVKSLRERDPLGPHRRHEKRTRQAERARVVAQAELVIARLALLRYVAEGSQPRQVAESLAELLDAPLAHS